jgi:hypothetical protein
MMHNCDLDSQTKESKALIPYSIKNLVLESPATWVTIGIDGSKILNCKYHFRFGSIKLKYHAKSIRVAK